MSKVKARLFEYNPRHGVYSSVQRYAEWDTACAECSRLQRLYGVGFYTYDESRDTMPGTVLETPYFIYCYEELGDLPPSRRCAKCKQAFFPRGSSVGSLCRTCGGSHSYNAKNDERKYKVRDGSITFGFELEMQSYDGDSEDYVLLRERLIKAGFLRTQDGTVTDEFKSPIYCIPWLPGNLKRCLEIASEFTHWSEPHVPDREESQLLAVE